MIKKILKYILIFGTVVLAIWSIKKITENYSRDPLCKKCNVVLISLDTLSAKHLPCYGYNKDTAPNLCQFGKDNILFLNSYSASSWTRPSQMSVFTGLPLATHGVSIPHIDKLDEKYKTITEILKSNNYQTIYSGSVIDDGSWPPSIVRGFDYKFEQDYKTGKLLDHWYRALDILKKNQQNKQPTFMFLHTYYVHAPYFTGKDNLKFVSKEDMQKYSDVPLTKDDYYGFSQKEKDYILKSLEDRVQNSNTPESLKMNAEMLFKIKNAKTLAETKRIFYSLQKYEIESFTFDWYINSIKNRYEYAYAATLYDERINQLDNEMKDFLDQINNKFAKDTIIIIYADHGETLGERGSLEHCSGFPDCLYNETIRVPLIIKIPGIKSKQISEITEGIDIYPTILKLLGIKVPDYVQGKSLTDLIKNGKKIHNYVVSERDNQKIVADKKWKAYFKDYKNITSDNVELYDLENDLYEQKNVAKENPDIIKTKIDQLNEFVSQNKNAKNVKYNFPDWIDNIKREKLIKQGYF